MTPRHNRQQIRAAILKSRLVGLGLYALSRGQRHRIPPTEAIVRREGRRHA
jgi:hypothetical protein